MAASLLMIAGSAVVLISFFWVTGMLRRKPKSVPRPESRRRADDAQLESPYDAETASRAAQLGFIRPWSSRNRP